MYTKKVIVPYRTIIFNDGSFFSKYDGNTTSYWYYIVGVNDLNNLNELM